MPFDGAAYNVLPALSTCTSREAGENSPVGFRLARDRLWGGETGRDATALKRVLAWRKLRLSGVFCGSPCCTPVLEAPAATTYPLPAEANAPSRTVGRWRGCPFVVPAPAEASRGYVFALLLLRCLVLLRHFAKRA